ncbi:unnamed protein product [Lota lota]
MEEQVPEPPLAQALRRIAEIQEGLIRSNRQQTQAFLEIAAQHVKERAAFRQLIRPASTDRRGDEAEAVRP